MATHSAPRARWAVFLTFLISGVLVGAWVPHIPLAKLRLDVGPAVFGLGLLAIAAGAVLSMPFAGACINRFGSARTALVCGLIFAGGFLGPVFAPSFSTFVIGGFLFGVGTGSLDVTMNAHGLAVEKALKKPIISGLHAAWSLGCMLGAFGGSWMLGAFGAASEAFTFAALFLVFHIVAYLNFLPTEVDRGLSDSHFAWPNAATFGLGALCFLALMVEGSVADWAGISTQERFAISAASAALGFAFYQTGMMASRFAGDYLRQRFGAVNLVVVSAVLAAIGMGLALIAPSFEVSLAAYALGGIGIGNIAPVLFAGGGRIEPEAPGHGIAAVVSMGYAGFLAGPPIIGFVAQFSNLTLALGLTVLGALIIAIFARGVAPADTY